MKRRMLSVLTMWVLPAAAWASSGEVSFLEGAATRTPASGGMPVALRQASPVGQGDLIETAAKARLEITLPDKSVVRLGPSARLKLTEAVFTDTGRSFKATLMLGKIWSKVSSVFGSDRNFEIHTERAVAGVRGTIFRVDADPSKAVLVKVYAGTVAVAGSSQIPLASPKKGERVQVPGPQQVTRKQWERLVSEMMQIKVNAEGEPGEPTKFAEADEAKDAWAVWNRERDSAAK